MDKVLIIGHGLCGAWLAYWLEQEGREVIVLDENEKITASRIASGIINPVTGRRYVSTWMIDELMPFAVRSYQRIENETGSSLIQQKNTIDFFPSVQMKEAFEKRQSEDGNLYLRSHGQDHQDWFNYSYGSGEIDPCWLVDVNAFLDQSHDRLAGAGKLVNGKFNMDQMTVAPAGIQYQDIYADSVIFCDGLSSMSNPFFNHLPFAPNKGEAIIIHAPGLPTSHIYKNGISIVPWSEGLFWIGSTYEWDFREKGPTQAYRERVERWLGDILKIPFRIEAHYAAIRPATLERRPFVGLYPKQRKIGILNGMGTKGVSLAPFFAHQLALHLVHGSPIHPEAGVDRFGEG